ncbi:MAG: DUF3644 domain-containing protein [Bacteroidota bacterium]
MSRGLPCNVKQSLEKSRDSALLAIETYNKPANKFRSGEYIMHHLLVIVEKCLVKYVKLKEYPTEKAVRSFSLPLLAETESNFTFQQNGLFS